MQAYRSILERVAAKISVLAIGNDKLFVRGRNRWVQVEKEVWEAEMRQALLQQEKTNMAAGLQAMED